jgi:GNAT superfamily N-acetyltransferase
MPIIKRNSNANQNIAMAHKSGVIQNLIKRIAGNYIIKLSNITRGGRYAVIGNRGEFLGFAAVSRAGNNLSVDLIAARKGYGNMLMRRIINNAKSSIRLNAKTNKSVSPASQQKLVNWYAKHGFRKNETNGSMKLFY